MNTKTSTLSIHPIQLPRMRPLTIHCFNFSRQQSKLSPENRIPKISPLTFQSSFIIKRLQPKCRQRKVHLRTISLHKITETKNITQLNQSLEVKGWSNKSVMELFDI